MSYGLYAGHHFSFREPQVNGKNPAGSRKYSKLFIDN